MPENNEQVFLSFVKNLVNQVPKAFETYQKQNWIYIQSYKVGNGVLIMIKID